MAGSLANSVPMMEKLKTGISGVAAGTGLVLIQQRENHHREAMKAQAHLIEVQKKVAEASVGASQAKKNLAEFRLQQEKLDYAKKMKPLYESKKKGNLRGGGKKEEIFQSDLDEITSCNNETPIGETQVDSVNTTYTGGVAVPSSPPYVYRDTNIFANYGGYFLIGMFGYFTITNLYTKSVNYIWPDQSENEKEIKNLKNQEKLLKALENLQENNDEIKILLQKLLEKNN